MTSRHYRINGYAPTVPRGINPLTADKYTLIAMVCDTLQNGANPTRGNLAFGLLVNALALPDPELPLDPGPYSWSQAPWNRRNNPNVEDSAFGKVKFMPRFGYAQEREKYR